MRTTKILSAALLGCPLAVSAAGTLGFAVGNTNPDNSCKTQQQYETDLDALADVTKVVRTYTSDGCDTAINIIPACKAKGFQVVLGVWPDTEESFAADKAALQASVPGNEETIYAITVGSESLYRGNFTGDELLEKINEIQEMFPDTLIGTADSWNKYADGTADPIIRGGVKLLLVNAFAYWQAQEIGNATATYFDDIMQAFNHIQTISGSTTTPELWNGETGWPTDGGSNYGPAIASTDNAITYWQEGVCGMLAWDVNLFYFEAFDEPNKPDSIGQDGSAANEKHWGAYTTDRKPKWDLSC